MHEHKLIVIPVAAMMILTAIGCDEDENKRMAERAERDLQRQAEQSRQMNELQHEVAEGAPRLVEADAQAREGMVELQRELQAERADVGHQRDLLEDDRRNMAAKRRLDPIIAAAVTNIGLLAACMAPLFICWHLLHSRINPADDQAVVEVLLEDLVVDRPLLLPRSGNDGTIGLRDDDAPRLSDELERAVE